ncbi:hypothetical protein CBR72_21940 [Bordetella hinzii]|nr:hypothetical protein CBR72_21940 [Bordetella hinzii]
MDIERQRVFAQCESWGEPKVAHLLSIPLAITSAADQDLMREWLHSRSEARRLEDADRQERALAAAESQLRIGRWALWASLVAIVISMVALVRTW